ncbi:MAG: hypothetical protein ACXVPX_06900 [Actinomycetota bacterium]
MDRRRVLSLASSALLIGGWLLLFCAGFAAINGTDETGFQHDPAGWLTTVAIAVVALIVGLILGLWSMRLGRSRRRDAGGSRHGA